MAGVIKICHETHDVVLRSGRRNGVSIEYRASACFNSVTKTVDDQLLLYEMRFRNLKERHWRETAREQIGTQLKKGKRKHDELYRGLKLSL